MGRSAFFIRLFGCPVHCPWCDSAGTWHKDYTPKRVDRIGADILAERAKASGAEFVVITGGEPTVHDLSDLTRELRVRKISIHLETCGAFPIRGHIDWMTLSPKWQAVPLKENLKAASELKIIVEIESSIKDWIREIGSIDRTIPVWLHPEWSKRSNEEVLSSITEWVKVNGAPFRAGIQAHKFFKADLLDPDSRKATPLGGDLELGY
ncbi:UNVERIFIED_CONTAM: hypothetical protein GTU68_036863 [Idotea baltica]|nr:hypothetical protein [Idotea baltica]